MNSLLLNEPTESATLQQPAQQPPPNGQQPLPQHQQADPEDIPQPVIPNHWNSKDLNYSFDYYQQSQLAAPPQHPIYYQTPAAQAASIAQPAASQLGQLLKRPQTPQAVHTQAQIPAGQQVASSYPVNMIQITPNPSHNGLTALQQSLPIQQNPLGTPGLGPSSYAEYQPTGPANPQAQQYQLSRTMPQKLPNPPLQAAPAQPPSAVPTLQSPYFSSSYQNVPVNLYNYPTYNNYEPLPTLNYSGPQYHYDYDASQQTAPAPQPDGPKRKRKHAATVYNMTPQTAARNRCPICQKQFKRPSSLQVHIYSHTGEKLFKCPWEACGKYFSVKSNMNRHYRLHQRDRNQRNST